MNGMTPTRKVAFGGLGGAISIIIVWGLNAGAGIEVPGEVAAAMTTVISFALAWATPENAVLK